MWHKFKALLLSILLVQPVFAQKKGQGIDLDQPFNKELIKEYDLEMADFIFWRVEETAKGSIRKIPDLETVKATPVCADTRKGPFKLFHHCVEDKRKEYKAEYEKLKATLQKETYNLLTEYFAASEVADFEGSLGKEAKKEYEGRYILSPKEEVLLQAFHDKYEKNDEFLIHPLTAAEEKEWDKLKKQTSHICKEIP